MEPRTSATHPLEIATLELPAGGRLGLTFCPGKHDRHAMSGPWERDLDTDLAAIVVWGATTLVTLMETPELIYLRVADLGTRAKAHGLTWHQLPIRDASIPDEPFERSWPSVGAELRRRLLAGEGVVIHCRGGLGRTGLVAAKLLIELGEDPAAALRRVRTARPGAVENAAQEAYLRHGPAKPV
ncbi:MAG: cyclin-dependent kinase inhibitor 3 family protein [Gammaproteobacteria bacterium]|nr:cyclin-dependent kinase inhibitor 3 family protein [Gammaproteobacteria bacterium]